MNKDFWDYLSGSLREMPYDQQVKMASFVQRIWPELEDIMQKQAASNPTVDKIEERVNNAGRAASKGFFGFLRSGLNAARNVKQKISDTYNKGVAAVNRGVDAVGNFANDAYNTAAGAVNKGVNAVNRGVDAVSNFANDAYDTAAGAVNKGVAAVNRGVDAVGNFANDAYNTAAGVVNKGVNAVNRGVDAVSNFASDTYNKGVNAVNQGVDAVGNFANNAYNTAAGAVNKGVDAVNRGVDAAGRFVDRVSNMTPDQMIDAAENKVNKFIAPVSNAVSAPIRAGVRAYDRAVDYGGRQLNALDQWQHNKRNDIADTLQGYVSSGADAINRGINRIR